MVKRELRSHYNVSNKLFSVMSLAYPDCFPVPNTVSVYYRDLEKNR